MSRYDFVTVWDLEFELPDVWTLIEQADDWPAWWPGVLESREIKPGDPNGIGSIRRTTWKSALPYKLTFDSETIRVEKFREIEIRAFGELTGRGLWHFEQIQDRRTRVQYDWQVTTDKAWMNLVAPLARPLFRWNHDIIMRRGEAGIRRRLASGP